MADVEKEGEVHGFKLVRREDYTSIYSGPQGSQRYVPGTTQWINVDPWRSEKYSPTPPMKLCSQYTLHFCRRAVETVAFVPYGWSIDGLVLLRVTPVRWPTDSGADAPLFVEEDSAHQPAKCGAHGLRVNSEVTDVDERRTLLSGKIETQTYMVRGKSVTTVVDGRITAVQDIDLLDNCLKSEIYCKSILTPTVTRYPYVLFKGADVDIPEAGDVSMSQASRATADVVWLVSMTHLHREVVVYGELSPSGASLRVIKRCTMSALKDLVDAALQAKKD